MQKIKTGMPSVDEICSAGYTYTMIITAVDFMSTLHKDTNFGVVQ